MVLLTTSSVKLVLIKMSIATDCIILGEHPDFMGHQVLYSTKDHFGWVEPKLSNDELQEFYTNKYRKTRNESPSAKYVSLMRGRAMVQKQFIYSVTKASCFLSMLDIGCGAGLLLEAFSDNSQSLVGYETDKVMAEYASSHLGAKAIVKCAHFDPGIIPVNRFDMISMSHVLEHIPDPSKFLNQLRCWLKPGGHIFLEVPNDPLDCVRWQVEKSIKGLAHISFFTPTSLRIHAENAGLDALKISTYGADIYSYWRYQIKQIKLSSSRFSRILHKMRCIFGLDQVMSFDPAAPLATENDSNGSYIRSVLRCKS